MKLPLISLTALALTIPVVAQAPAGVDGFWSTGKGSVLHVHPCGPKTCITVVTLSPTAPGVFDAHNPDASLRSRPICHLTIGTDFDLSDPTHGDNGHIYDPENGKTYKASMVADGNRLDLRGYVGIKALGRTETWNRTTPSAATCAPPRNAEH